jgi:hypothetical protein
MEQLRRNVAELAERLSQLDASTIKAVGRNDALELMIRSIIETHSDLDALCAAIDLHRGKAAGMPSDDLSTLEFKSTLSRFDAVIKQERRRRHTSGL